MLLALFALLWVPHDPALLTVALVQPSAQEVWMDGLHQCENVDNLKKVWDTNNQWSYGKYQWQMKSWLKYQKQGATRDNINDEEMQDKITKYVLDTVGEDDWVICSARVDKKLGAYPRVVQPLAAKEVVP